MQRTWSPLLLAAAVALPALATAAPDPPKAKKTKQVNIAVYKVGGMA